MPRSRRRPGDFTDRFSGTLGIRYTNKSKDYSAPRRRSGPAIAGGRLDLRVQGQRKLDGVDPTIAVDYKLTNETLFYASTTEGFKSGALQRPREHAG